MKINLIYHDFSSNVVLDAEVFNFIFKKFREKPKIVSVNVNNYKCDEADINIFLEKINYSFSIMLNIIFLFRINNILIKQWSLFLNLLI